MGCNHDCESCSGSCGEPESLLKKPHEKSTIRKVIGVISGKLDPVKAVLGGRISVEGNLEHIKAIAALKKPAKKPAAKRTCKKTETAKKPATKRTCKKTEPKA